MAKHIEFAPVSGAAFTTVTYLPNEKRRQYSVKYERCRYYVKIRKVGMPLIPVVIKGQQIKVESDVEELTFREMNLKEVHLEEFIRKNIGKLFGDEESLLIVGQQVIDNEGSRSDLVALDDDGCLVLIEIKRDLKDIKSRSEALESQAIRYAASLARIRDELDLVKTMFAKYIDRHRDEEPFRTNLGPLSASELAAREVRGFLRQNSGAAGFNRKQRIILIASEFDEITLSSSAWLIKNNVDLSCYQLSPLKLSGKDVFSFERLLPLDSVEDFFIGINAKDVDEEFSKEAKKKAKRKSLPRMPILFEWKIVNGGDRLSIKNFPNSDAVVVDPKTVEFRGSKMGFNDWGQTVTGWSSICIYEWAIHIEKNKSLHELRLLKLRELEGDTPASRAA